LYIFNHELLCRWVGDSNISKDNRVIRVDRVGSNPEQRAAQLNFVMARRIQDASHGRHDQQHGDASRDDSLFVHLRLQDSKDLHHARMGLLDLRPVEVMRFQADLAFVAVAIQ
jgi:hypothetical protein